MKNKISSLFILYLILIFYFMVSFIKSYKVQYLLFEMVQNKSWNFSLEMSLSLELVIFFCTIFLVTLIVMSFSEKYMESYNYKKFLKFTMFFFSSMLILIMSNSNISFMMGWDYLGLSSIFLIMFYPNKNSMSNSIFTMLFNRTGDILLIFSFSYLYISYNNSMEMNKFNFLILMLFFLCSLTKSAQYPLKSWLPAAMSAPTPISAMVHSSTLVTAGIFLNYKMIYYYKMSFILNLGLWISIFTCLSGSIMALSELDLKKVIAFSTMSQISMIMMMLFFILKMYMFMHLVYHAFFKTLIFLSSGLNFMILLNSQMGFINFNDKNMIMIKTLFLISIFSMMGTIFSSSFITKHYLMSFTTLSQLNFSIIILLVLSIFTILYSKKILKFLFKFKLSYFKSLYMKFFNSHFFLLFWMFIMMLPYIYFFIMMNRHMFIFIEEYLMINFFFLMVLMFFNLKINKFYFLNLSFSVFYIKKFLIFISQKFLMIFMEKIMTNKIFLEEKVYFFKNMNMNKFNLIYSFILMVVMTSM